MCIMLMFLLLSPFLSLLPSNFKKSMKNYPPLVRVLKNYLLFTDEKSEARRNSGMCPWHILGLLGLEFKTHQAPSLFSFPFPPSIPLSLTHTKLLFLILKLGLKIKNKKNFIVSLDFWFISSKILCSLYLLFHTLCFLLKCPLYIYTSIFKKSLCMQKLLCPLVFLKTFLDLRYFTFFCTIMTTTAHSILDTDTLWFVQGQDNAFCFSKAFITTASILLLFGSCIK